MEITSRLVEDGKADKEEAEDMVTMLDEKRGGGGGKRENGP